MASPSAVLVQLPDWPSFAPAPDDQSWADFQRLARAGIDVHHAELGLLLARVSQAPLDCKGPDGTPLLTALLRGWGRVVHTYVGEHPEGEPLARFPLPGEEPWDGTGAVVSWELPAAAFIARGGHPFEEGPDGARPWDVAVQVGAAAVVAQMLRSPACPRDAGRVDWNALRLRAFSTEDEEGGRRANRNLAHERGHSLEEAPEPARMAARALCEPLFRALVAEGAPVSLFDLVTLSSSDSGKTAALVRVLGQTGADAIEEDPQGLTPLERWSVGQHPGPDLRQAWAQIAATAPAERRGRAVAAALFANATDVLPQLPEKPRGKAWGGAPYGAPHGLSWVEWAALGVVARQGGRSGDPGAAALQALPLQAEVLTERERAWIAIAQRLTLANLQPLTGGIRLQDEHFRSLWGFLRAFQLNASGITAAVAREMANGFRSDLCGLAAELLAEPGMGAVQSLATVFLGSAVGTGERAPFEVDELDEAHLGDVVRACARAFVFTDTRSWRGMEAWPNTLSALFDRAHAAGYGAEVLTKDDARLLKIHSEKETAAERRALHSVWTSWLVRCALPQAQNTVDRARPRF